MNNEDKLKSLLEYMEKEHGVTPENIDEKLKEMREEFNKRITITKEDSNV